MPALARSVAVLFVALLLGCKAAPATDDTPLSNSLVGPNDKSGTSNPSPVVETCVVTAISLMPFPGAGEIPGLLGKRFRVGMTHTHITGPKAYSVVVSGRRPDGSCIVTKIANVPL